MIDELKNIFFPEGFFVRRQNSCGLFLILISQEIRSDHESRFIKVRRTYIHVRIKYPFMWRFRDLSEE